MNRKLISLIIAAALLLQLTCAVFAEDSDEADGVLSYTKVYEPNTSWPMAATVAWRADESVLSAAAEEIRPATAFVWLDADLKVYSRAGSLICTSLQDYVAATAGSIIPAFCISDAETASALQVWLADSGLQDCFVVSTRENLDLVAQTAEPVHIRGMLDFTEETGPILPGEIAADVCRAHGKVVLLSAATADRKTVRQLQSLGLSVWVSTPVETRALVTAYTNGVNGVLVDDYLAAIAAQELFQDDAPSLLRLPQIIGHRGDPSTYVENTLDSALGAYTEGVDAVELDIQLSRDEQLFVWHDEGLQRFFCLDDPVHAEALTLEELRSLSFNWDDPERGILAANIVPAAKSRYGTLYGQEEQKAYTVPTFQEYLQSFRDTDLVLNTEIKSYDPSILSVMKAAVDEYALWDQFSCVTFNEAVLDAMYSDHPEIPVGLLGFAEEGQPAPGRVALNDYEAITRHSGPEAALAVLYGTLDRWNAYYSPACVNYGAKMVRAGRHRGLTVWPWVYSPNEDFARDYLRGVNGMTTNFPWTTSDFIMEISSEDVSADSVTQLQKPMGKTRAGALVPLNDAELVKLETVSQNEALMIWRYRADLILLGNSYGSYYLYSNPFLVCAQDVNRFSDVPEDAYYAEPVFWAVQNGITAGTGTDTFSPDKDCTRAQAVTFLWRSFGCPEPESAACSFTDVSKTAYYYKAVLWAAQRGITNGTSETTFSPDLRCSRGQIVTFLHRASGDVTQQLALPFHDVSPGDFYYDAVCWAYANKITDGTSETTFSPAESCTRAQVVTFLFRANQEKHETVQILT